jgi:hypothetical protein
MHLNWGDCVVESLLNVVTKYFTPSLRLSTAQGNQGSFIHTLIKFFKIVEVVNSLFVF